MIEHSFIVLDGIGEKTERDLWEQGILSWDDFLSVSTISNFGCQKKRLYEESLQYFSHELQRMNEKPFAEFIKPKDHWRLFKRFRKYAVCLDIETNGLPLNAGGETTVVGLYDGNSVKQFVKGRNLSEDALFGELSQYKLLITFFGSSFDIPFLKRQFRSLPLDLPHFDLCFSARRVGMTGGLKKIETDLGLTREKNISGLSGYDAVLLWKEWCHGNQTSLNTLLEYNCADTVNLMDIANIIYEMLLENTGFQKYRENSVS
ncbi:MAG: hypothetical protein BV458_06800 [Thermoplasmata archaeon M9B2D]|nr:MAG: hypothetical protein BV458_06800 [Thermoplasmata archaeon M9B2D]